MFPCDAGAVGSNCVCLARLSFLTDSPFAVSIRAARFDCCPVLWPLLAHADQSLTRSAIAEATGGAERTNGPRVIACLHRTGAAKRPY